VSQQILVMHPTQRSVSYLPADTPGQDDGALIRRMAAGDEKALGLLYDRWSPLLHSVARRIVADPDDAEEVLEEAFWQAWRQAGRYEEGRGGVSTWLTMIVRSRALDRVRSRGRLREERWENIPEPAAGDVEGAGAAPDAAAEQDEQRRLIAAAVAQLPPEQRETVELAYFRGLSQSEIAAKLGQPLGTVKTRARLALQKLRESLVVFREEGG
jgi:RNA polymerase sigma-70 factor (ECF subfamily)